MVQRLESINGIENVLENKAGTDYSIFTNLDVESLVIKIENEVGKDTIQNLKQIDSKMDQFFRYKLIEVPEIEEL